ncbi:MAG: undecaprenyldiphospho-muramoylpentapeptide beta-N-acetylglucosaminyltransferase [Christensenellaceae bacterium]|nr:undecaprenyldiphospho-muramoylpentapeptide beta-N-acetylglucosaminyltransferase [Christensenellaceae bacterium]
MKRIVLTGGGTAGHVTANLALIPHLLQRGWEIFYIGSETGMERDLVSPVPGVKYHAIATGKLRRYFDLKNLSDPFRVVKGAAQASSLLRKLKPDLVFSKGGFVSVPVALGAFFNGVPLICHESDLSPGLANKLCQPFAKKVCTAFPETARLLKKGVYTGTPLRDELFLGTKRDGLARFSLDSNKPVLMVTGGSSGAVALNNALREALPVLLPEFQVLHLCGKGNQSNLSMRGYVELEYLSDGMAEAFACADLLVSRAGANTLCEILALRKPNLLIPYPKGSTSRGDQIENAASFEKRGLSMVLRQEDLSAETLAARVKALYAGREGFINAMCREPSGNGLNAVLEIIEESAKKK